MASSALDKWKERTRQAQKPAETKLSAWEKRVTQAQKENNAAKAKEKAQQTALTRANENAERQLPKNDPLTVSAVQNSAKYSGEKKNNPGPTVELTNPRATTAAQRKTEKAPISDRAKKTAEIRKDIDTTPTQSRVGKGAQSVFLSPFASMEYLGEAAKQTAENRRKNAASAGVQDYAAAVSEFNRVRKLYPEGSAEYQTALRNLELAQQGDTRQYLDTVVDPNSRASRFMGGVNQLQEEALEGTSGAGRFLGEAALSIVGNLSKLPLNAILPGASLALMGAEAAAGKAYELGQQGVGAGEALTRGLVSGGIEALTEKVPLDNLMDIVKTGGKTGLWNIVKQAATEAGEEGISYILNYGADKVAGDPEAEFIWNDFWKSMGMGALSGGIMGGGATAINRVNAAAVGKNYQDVAPELIAEGLELGQNTEAFRTATEMQRKVDAGKTLSNVDVGRMVQDNEAAAAPLKQIALEMAEEEIRAREQAQQAAVAVNEAQQVQTPVLAEMPVQEAVQAQEAQRAQGMPLPEKRQMQPLENRRQAQYTETRENTEGGVNGGEEVYLRTGSQRYDGADPGRQVRQLEESAGRDPGGQDTGLRPKDGGAAALRSGKQVTTGALGITGGAVNDSVRIVTDGETEATKAAKTLAKERGLRLTLFTGGNLHINGEECRAYITGDRVFVRADHNEFDASQLMRHEVTHDRIAKGEIDIKAATETIRKRLGGRNNVQRAAQTYASAFAGIDMTVEEALEEIICDSVGDMNVFSDTAAEAAFGEVLEITREAVSENSVGSKTDPPVEGKASRDKVNKTKWAADEGLLDYKEQAAFFHRVADIKKLGHKAPRTNDGKYIVDLGNKLMITDANWRSPSLDSVIVLSDNNETSMSYAKEVIFNEMANEAQYEQARRLIERTYWPGYVDRYDAENYRTSGGEIARGERANRGRDSEKSQVKEDLAALGVEEVKGTIGKASRESKKNAVDSDGKKLSAEQEAFFSQSKVRDENGNLKVMYHGSRKAGFHVFDVGRSDDHISFFFVDRNNVAETYSGTDETYAAKTLRTAEDFYSLFEEIEAEGVYEVKEENGKFVLYDMGEVVAESDTAQGLYEKWTDYAGVGYGSANYKVYLNLKNPLVVDAEGRNWNNLVGWSKAANLKAEDVTVKRVGDEFRLYKNEQEIENASITVNQYNQNMDTDVLKSIMVDKVNNILSITTEGKTTTRDVSKWAKAQGYDGVIFNNIVDVGGHGNGSEGAATVAIAFDSNQIKSVANEKPTSDPDIRFSREAKREDVLKAVDQLLEEAEEKLDEQELTDEMYYGRKLAEQKAHDKEKLERLREQKNERIAQVKAEGREAVKTARIEERLKRDEKIAQLKEKQRQKLEDTVTAERMAAGRELAEQKAHDKARREKASESRKAAKLRSQINRHVNSMQQLLLRPSDKRHVPEHLRKATANVLSAINMESGYELSFGADAKYHRVKPGTDPHAELTKRTQAFRELRKAYTAIVQNAEEEALIIDPDLMGDSATGAPGLFDQLMDLDGKRIADMNSSELEVVWKVLRSVEHSISNAGKLLSKSKYESTKSHAEAFAADAAKRTDAKSILRKKISLDLEDPYTFFSRYGESGKAIYRMLRDAQDSAAVKVDTIAQKVQEIVDTKTVDSIQKERHDFTTEAGDQLTLTTGQLMSLYNLMGRTQAQDHLMKGGILQPEIKRSGKQKRIDRGNEMIRLSAEDLNGLAKLLTDKQKGIAIALQKIMTEDLAAWGNEASMAAYGYQKFTGEDYWPIKSAVEGLTSTVEKNSGQARSIKNIGMAKNTVPHANNALEIGDVFDVFAQHTADMVDYSSWLLPMEDLNRLYNWKYKDQMGNKTGKTVKGILEAKGGAGSNKYWTNLMEDIQNGIAVKQDTNVESIINRLIGNAKGASVGANIRVVVQQPTAYLRAAAIFSPDSLTKGVAKGVTSGNGWEKAKKWAPIAHIKDVGGFDQGNAQTISQQMYGTKTKLETFNEKFSWAAAKADAITWGRLWNAAEWETKKRFSDLEPGSDAFYKKTAELFTDMVDQSQVVDGILQRSQLMRSGNAINKQAAAFMGEPTKTLNMMLREVDAWRHSSGKARSDARKRVGRTAIALGVTAGINALAQAIVDAMRDDDKEKEYLERVWSAFSGMEGDEESGAEIAKNVILKGNLAGNINPVSMIPYGSDLMSIFQGYDVTRADADVIAAVVADYNLFTKSMSGEGSKTPLYAAKRLITSIGKMFGVSAVNLGRDIWAVIGTAARGMADYQMLYEMDRMVYTLENNKKKFITTLYLAEKAGDEKAAEHIRSDLLANGIDEEKIEEYFTKFRKAEESYATVENEVGERVSSAVAESKIYREATAEQQEKADEMVTQWARYQAMLGEDPDYVPPKSQNWMLTAENGAEVGLSEAEFILYRLAVEMADADGNGKIKQEEFTKAANTFGLTNRELAYLWEEDRNWSEKTNPYK